MKPLQPTTCHRSSHAILPYKPSMVPFAAQSLLPAAAFPNPGSEREVISKNLAGTKM